MNRTWHINICCDIFTSIFLAFVTRPLWCIFHTQKFNTFEAVEAKTRIRYHPCQCGHKTTIQTTNPTFLLPSPIESDLHRKKEREKQTKYAIQSHSWQHNCSVWEGETHSIRNIRTFFRMDMAVCAMPVYLCSPVTWKARRARIVSSGYVNVT